MDRSADPPVYRLKIKHIRYLTENTFAVQLHRDDFRFKAGQYISLGLPGAESNKEYTLYSGENDEYLEILVREIIEGDLTRQLKLVRPGQIFEINGPFGFLKINEEDKHTARFVFIATGTGIAPFHSFIRSYPGIDYLILHGTRYYSEAYDSCEYPKNRYIHCTTGDSKGNFHGRVTSYLKTMEFTSRDIFYLCGNNKMIHDACEILQMREVAHRRIFSEAYF